MMYLLLVLHVLSIFFCHSIAKSRGAQPVFWGVMGGIFGLLAVPFALRAKSK